jgi:hypothetical protein
MKTYTVPLAVVCLVVCFTLALPALAQEGHPMSGSWVGDWGPTPTQRNRVVVVLDWNGSAIVGTINPGRNAIPIKVATVNPRDWSIHMEADTKDAQGRAVTYVIDGKIDDIEPYNRTIAGTWRVNGSEGTFSITRQ